MYWNKKGTGVLLMTSVEVDKSGSSYYGKQTLHFITPKGDNSIVQLGKFFILCFILLIKNVSNVYYILIGYLIASEHISFNLSLVNIKCVRSSFLIENYEI